MKTQLTNEAAEEIMRKHGMKIAGPDHPIYSSGPMLIFTNRSRPSTGSSPSPKAGPQTPSQSPASSAVPEQGPKPSDATQDDAPPVRKAGTGVDLA